MPPDPSARRPPPGSAPRRLEVTVAGRVQGVGFRFFALREATALGLHGWVRNESDGSVRCVAEGPDEALEAFLSRLRAGPPGAVVSDVAVAWRAPGGEGPGFRVRSGSHPGD